jgi:hypothetical protein
VVVWSTPDPPDQWSVSVAIEVFAQAAQSSFLNAQRFGQTGFLALLFYVNLVFLTQLSYLVFMNCRNRAFGLAQNLFSPSETGSNCAAARFTMSSLCDLLKRLESVWDFLKVEQPK